MFFKQYWNSLGQPNLHSFTGPILYKKLLWIQVSYLQLSVLGSYTVLESWTLHVSSTRHYHIVSSTSMADFCPGPQNVSHIYIMIKAENAIVSKLIYSYACKISPTRVLLRLTNHCLLQTFDWCYSRIQVTLQLFCPGVLFAEGQYTEIQGAEF